MGSKLGNHLAILGLLEEVIDMPSYHRPDVRHFLDLFFGRTLQRLESTEVLR
jgi:hypothetical protein